MRKTPLKSTGPKAKPTSGEKKPRRRLKRTTRKAAAKKEQQGIPLKRSEVITLAVGEWHKIVVALADGKCEWCGKPAYCGHHMIAQAQGNFLRFKIENGVAVCYGCHVHFHQKNALKGWRLFREQRPDSAEFVEANENTTAKYSTPELLEILDGLRAMAIEIGCGQ